MIYFLLAGDRVKIGVAKYPVNRVATIQTSCPYRLEVLLILPGSYQEEHDLHHKFRNYRCTGEWFEFGQGIHDYIALNEHNDRKDEYGYTTEEFAGNQQLRTIMKQSHVYAQDLGDAVGVSQQAISRLLKAEETGSITVRSIRRLARALGYTFEYRFKKN